MTDVRRIAAVVVTFNRLALLQRLVPALAEVAGLDEVLVVDNHSSDGTAGWLREQAATSRVPVLSRTLDDNAGGAGGFHEGLRWAVERGADLVWLMDDDGLPDPDCLVGSPRARERPRLLGPGRRRRGRPRPAGVPDPAPGLGPRGPPDGGRRGSRAGRSDPRHRHPVQRGAGHPRARASGSACRGRSSSSGATTTSTASAPSAPAPASPRSSARASCTPRSATWARPWRSAARRTTTPRATSSTTAWPATTWSTSVSTAGGLHAAGVRRQDAVVLHLHPARPGAGSGSASTAWRAALKGDFTGHRRFVA